MSRRNAIVCTCLLAMVVFGVSFVTCFVRFGNGINLFNCIASATLGLWESERFCDFYKWLRKDAENND